MWRLIRDWKTVVGAVCFLVFAAGLEAYFDQGAINRERATSRSLAAQRVHQALNPLPLGRSAHSSKARRHTGNAFEALAKSAPPHLVSGTELLSCSESRPNRNSEMRPFSIRPPPAS
jgi:hypothetical protein